MNLKVNRIKKDEEYYVYLEGEIDVYTAETLKAALLPLTEVNGNKVIVDFSKVTYIDSTGLGIFIGALKSTQKNNTSIKLTSMTERVRRLFRITGLDEIINIEESTREEAK